MADKIILKTQEIARAHGIENANQLRVALGVAPMVAWRLWKSDLKQMDFRTLATLCRVFDCQPGDLLEYKREKKTRRKG